MPRPTVFIVNKSHHDFSAARHYGDLRFITEGEVSKFDTAQMLRDAEAAVEQSQPGDFLVLNSFPLLCSLVTAVFAAKHGRVDLLVFQNSRYVKRSYTLLDLMETICKNAYN